MACGVLGRQSASSRPASRAKAATRLSRERLPSPPSAATAGMLSASHCRGTPPSQRMSSAMQASRSSLALVGDRTKWCIRDHPSVEAYASKRYPRPERSCMVTPSFQSNCSCSPGAVSNLGCASGAPPRPTAMPRPLRWLVKALWPGTGGSSPA